MYLFILNMSVLIELDSLLNIWLRKIDVMNILTVFKKILLWL